MKSTLQLAALGSSLVKGLLESAYIRPLTIGKRAKRIVNMNPNRCGVSSSYICNSDMTKLRLFTSLFDDNNKGKKESGFLSKIVEKSKSLLPDSWFSKKTQQKDNAASQILGIRNEDAKDIERGISALLKDTPFPIRIFGRMISPLVSSMADQISEQTRLLDDVLDEAQNMILSDSKAAMALGGSAIKFGSPFSQSSSTVSINGKSTTNINASFPARGPDSSGVVSVSASGSKIESLTLEVAGRYYYIDLATKNQYSSGFTSTKSFDKNMNIREDNIIDAEFVEKDK